MYCPIERDGPVDSDCFDHTELSIDLKQTLETARNVSYCLMDHSGMVESCVDALNADWNLRFILNKSDTCNCKKLAKYSCSSGALSY